MSPEQGGGIFALQYGGGQKDGLSSFRAVGHYAVVPAAAVEICILEEFEET